MRRVGIGLACLLLLGGCGAPDAPAATSSPVPVTTSSATTTTAPTTAAPTTPPTTAAPTTVPPTSATSSTPPPAPDPLAGKVVVLDPGHNGGNAANPQIVNQPVPDGTGGTKPCNTTGTASNAGYPEHAFTWDVVTRIRTALEAKGITVVLTRTDDSGVGPCVDKRAAIGNAAKADAVVSIHGDGSAAGNRGFFCMTSTREPAGQAVAQRSLALAAAVRDALAASGAEPPSNYVGTDGLALRSDLAGLNLSTRPTTMCELGNMRSAADIAVMGSPSGRAALASAVVQGILTFLV